MSNHIEELISAYIDNELSENERQQVKEHLENCPECYEVLNDLMAIQSQVITAFQSFQAPDTLEDNVIHAINSDAPAYIVKQRNWFLIPMLSALCFVAIAFVLTGSFLFNLGSIVFKIIFNLFYAFSSILGSVPYISVGLVGFSLLLIIASSVSLKRLLKTEAIQGDSI